MHRFLLFLITFSFCTIVTSTQAQWSLNIEMSIARYNASVDNNGFNLNTVGLGVSYPIVDWLLLETNHSIGRLNGFNFSPEHLEMHPNIEDVLRKNQRDYPDAFYPAVITNFRNHSIGVKLLPLLFISDPMKYFSPVIGLGTGFSSSRIYYDLYGSEGQPYTILPEGMINSLSRFRQQFDRNYETKISEGNNFLTHTLSVGNQIHINKAWDFTVQIKWMFSEEDWEGNLRHNSQDIVYLYTAVILRKF